MKDLIENMVKAIHENDINQVKKNLKQGAPIRLWNIDALFEAEKIGNEDIISLVSYHLSNHNKLCHLIKENNIQEIICNIEQDPLVLNRVYDVHGPDWSPLMHVSKSGNLSIAKLFLDKGAYPFCTYDACSINSSTIAQYYNNHGIVSELKKLKVESHSFTNCLFAAKLGDLKKVKYYLDLGIDINSHDSCNASLLPNAFKSENLELIELLIKEGAEVNKCNGYEGYIWFESFIKSNHIDIVKFILELGYNVNHIDKWGNSCLKYSKRYNQTEMEHLFMTYGATR